MIDRESPYVLRLGESNRRSVENDNFGGGSSGMSLDQLAYQCK